MKSIFEITFPDGISGYTLAELWEIYDKLGVEIHERQLVVEAKKHINKVIGNYSSIDAFLDAVKEMPELEKKRAEILEKLNNESDYEKIAALSADLEKISEQLEEHEMRWLELQEMMS